MKSFKQFLFEMSRSGFERTTVGNPVHGRFIQDFLEAREGLTSLESTVVHA